MAPTPARKNKTYTLGIDLGGTKILAAIVDATGKVVATAKKTTQAQAGPQVVIKRLIKAMEEAVENAGISREDVVGIGIGVPGIVDSAAGVIVNITNIPGMQNVEIAKMLRAWRDVPVALSNDVRVAAIGELRRGAGRGLRNMVTIFVGTGIGGGLILNGEIHSGSRGSAGEIGHIVTLADGPYAPGGGVRGGIEALASRTAIERDLRAGLAAGRKSILPRLLAEKDNALTSNVLTAAVEAGDVFTIETLERAAHLLGLHAASLINTLDPEALIYGGGVIEGLGKWMVGRIARTARQHAINRAGIDGIQIVEAELGEHSGVVGAALLARDAATAGATPAAAPVAPRRRGRKPGLKAAARSARKPARQPARGTTRATAKPTRKR